MRTCVVAGNPEAGSWAPGPVQTRATAIAEPGDQVLRNRRQQAVLAGQLQPETTMTDPAEHAAEISDRPSSAAGFKAGAT